MNFRVIGIMFLGINKSHTYILSRTNNIPTYWHHMTSFGIVWFLFAIWYYSPSDIVIWLISLQGVSAVPTNKLYWPQSHGSHGHDPDSWCVLLGEVVTLWVLNKLYLLFISIWFKKQQMENHQEQRVCNNMGSHKRPIWGFKVVFCPAQSNPS